MTTRQRILLATSLALGVTVIVAWLVEVALPTRQKLRAKVTTTRMRQLAGVLMAEEPEKLDQASLRPIARKYHRSECLIDGWGRPFLIQRQDDPGSGSRYLIISVGRDGKRGTCCRRWTQGDWDADAVLLGNSWLQVW